MSDKLNPGECQFLVHGIPTKLRDKFKSWCVLRGTTMKAKIILLMKETVRKDERNRRDT